MAMFERHQLYNGVNAGRTKALFYEFGVGEHTILTLGDHIEGYPSLRTLYVNMCTDDPSEYVFAVTVFGDVQFWERLKKAPWMPAYVEAWKHESEIKRKSMAFDTIMKEVKEDGKSSFQAAKYLIEEPWRKGAVERRKTKASARDAFDSVRDDVNRLKEEGLLM
jgi:hypothetical protein